VLLPLSLQYRAYYTSGVRPATYPDLARLDGRIAELLDTSPSFLSDLRRFTLTSRGKKLRGRLILALGDFLSADGEKLLEAAAAVETVHLATLIHDDIIDHADRRRSGAALHRSKGIVPAVLYGDILFTRGAAAIHSIGKRRLTELFLATVHSLCSGEILESELAGKFPWKVRDYYRVIDLKTASLFRFCCRAPGIIAGLRGRRLEVLDRFGFNLGIFYQICDDCMDFAPPSSSGGKDRLQDLRNSVPNLPVLLASRDRKLRGDLVKAMGSATDERQRRRVAARVRKGGFVKEASGIAAEYLERASDDLSTIRKWGASQSARRLDGYMEELGFILARAAGD